MTIRIGHAASDEKGNYRGGASGDNNGREVSVRLWYNRPWNCIIRFKDPAMREKTAHAMENACANDNIGYDQYQRNTLLAGTRDFGYDPSKVAIPCETDCSALVSLCCMYAGVPESSLVISGNSPTTSTLKNRLLHTGLVEVLTEKKYLTSGNLLLRGDILLYEGHHTAVALDSGSDAVIPSAYTKSQFIKDIQAAVGAKTDGIAGPETFSKTVTVSAVENRRHAVIKPIQAYLYAIGYTEIGAADGVAGNKFTVSVKRFQREHFCEADGEITARNKTWKCLLGIV